VDRRPLDSRRSIGSPSYHRSHRSIRSPIGMARMISLMAPRRSMRTARSTTLTTLTMPTPTPTPIPILIPIHIHMPIHIRTLHHDDLTKDRTNDLQTIDQTSVATLHHPDKIPRNTPASPTRRLYPHLIGLLAARRIRHRYTTNVTTPPALPIRHLDSPPPVRATPQRDRGVRDRKICRSPPKSIYSPRFRRTSSAHRIITSPRLLAVVVVVVIATSRVQELQELRELRVRFQVTRRPVPSATRRRLSRKWQPVWIA
jgi:hypothetical protein